MINLLPSSIKKEIRFGRQNNRLVKLSIIFLLTISGSVLIGLAGLFYMNQSIDNLKAQADRTQLVLKSQKIDDTQKQVEEISGNLKLTTQVLSRQVFFSKLIQQIGAAMPTNTILTDLKITKTEGGIDLTAIASDYNTATQVQVNLADPANKIFDKADILNAACVANPADPKYPCTITLRARFSKDNSFTLVGGTKK